MVQFHPPWEGPPISFEKESLSQNPNEVDEYAWALFDLETGEIMIKVNFATLSKAKRSARDYAIRRTRYAGDHPVELRIYDREPNIDRLDEGVIFEGQIVFPGGRVIEAFFIS